MYHRTLSDIHLSPDINSQNVRQKCQKAGYSGVHLCDTAPRHNFNTALYFLPDQDLNSTSSAYETHLLPLPSNR